MSVLDRRHNPLRRAAYALFSAPSSQTSSTSSAPYHPTINFDARDAASSAGLVTSWTDRVAGIVTTPDAAGHEPHLNTVLAANQCVDYTADGQNLISPDVASSLTGMNGHGAFTWSFRLRVPTVAGVGSHLAACVSPDLTTALPYAFAFIGASHPGAIRNVDLEADSTLVVAPATWASVVVQYTGAAWKFAVNGTLDPATYASAGALSSALRYLTIGNLPSLPLHSLRGQIGNWLYWPRLLSTTEIVGMAAYDAGLWS